MALRTPSIYTAGVFEAELCYKDRKCTVTFVVVEEKARPILSRQTSEILATLKIEINSVSKENLVKNSQELLMGWVNSKIFKPSCTLMNQCSPPLKS